MTDYTELKRLAESANAVKSDVNITMAVGTTQEEVKAVQDFLQLAMPKTILALIAENERLKREEKNDAIAYRAVIERQNELRAEIRQLNIENERQAAQFKEWQESHHANYCKAAAERDQLKAENEELREDIEYARRQPLYSTRRNAARYLHLKATWGDGLLLERLGGNVLPADWDAEIDKDMSKEA